ncbi:MAG: M24 family metallopeptidase [Leptodesmis sp.]|uniref:M24 family metallopeptidase n=1 Tax=Leptodesmis sp. TaxID=3100501 RepID=UPI003D097A64
MGSLPERKLSGGKGITTTKQTLTFAGLPLENAAIRLEQGKLALFMDGGSPASALWHGESPTPAAIAVQIGADAVYPLADLKQMAAGYATILVQDGATRALQSQLLHRAIAPIDESDSLERQLIQAIVALRLTHDHQALEELRQAAAISVEAHKAGMRATPMAKTEAEVRAAMEAVILAYNATTAYTSIVTVHGEVLHNNHYHHALRSGDLLLADVGAEIPSGWASDITRTWPVSGKFSPTQRSLYEVMLQAHDRCIAADEIRQSHIPRRTGRTGRSLPRRGGSGSSSPGRRY